MKLLQTVLEKNFTIEHKGKTYYVSYINSDGQILLNRFGWEVYDEESEELDIYLFANASRNKREEVLQNQKLYICLIKFCMRHFNDYKPEVELDEL